jgi:hypothetical protein
VAFVVAFGSWAVPVPAWAVCFSVLGDVIVNSPSAVITAVTTSITPVRRRSKRILLSIGQKRWNGDGFSGEFRVFGQSVKLSGLPCRNHAISSVVETQPAVRWWR